MSEHTPALTPADTTAASSEFEPPFRAVGAVHAFASDNYAGALPEVLEAIAEANAGHEPAYGRDRVTELLAEAIRLHFGDAAQVFPVFNGTGANVTALSAMVPRWGAVVTADTAHIENDEGGAPEKVGGLKLLTTPAADGKLTPAAIEQHASALGDVHSAQPLAVSITQSTEYGTLYSPAEIAALAETAHRHGMGLHLDGARLFAAAAALGLPLRAFTTDAGVDVLSLGGTKAGAIGAEAVVVLDAARTPGIEFVRKGAMQLASKMRFVSAQLLALLTDDLGVRAARHANAMAARLRAELEGMPGLEFVQPTQANVVFARLDTAAADRVRESHAFYDWNRARGEVRWMCSFDTTEADVDAFVAAVRREVAAASGAGGDGTADVTADLSR